MAQRIQYPGTGCIVECMQGNVPQIAWVLEEQNGRLRLLLPNRRETTLQAARILPWAGPVLTHEGTSRDAIIGLLEKHRKLRSDAVAVINPLELWELVQGEVVQGTAEWFAELVHANPDADTVAAFGQVLLACKSHFKFVPPHFEVLSQETVDARLAEHNAAQERERFFAESESFLNALWIAYQKGQVIETPQDVSFEVAQKLRSLIKDRLKDPETKHEENLWKQLVKGLKGIGTTGEDMYLPLFLAESWGLVPAHHNIWLDRAEYDANDSWSEPFAAEIDALLAPVQAANGQTPPMPHNTLPFISIDSPDTKDIDDAFYIEAHENGWMLTLALACPALDWQLKSDFDTKVQERGTSLYLPEGTYHMLPERLGIDGYSLTENTWRPALLVRCTVSADGAILSCDPSFAFCQVAANLHYEACEAVLNQEGDILPTLQESVQKAKQFEHELQLAFALATARQACRLRQGAVIIERPETEFTLEGQGQDITVHAEPEPVVPMAHLLVSEQMIVANTALAHWAVEREIPLLFRTQDVAVPKEYTGLWSNPEDIARVVKTLAPAKLETTPRPHVGIGEQMYATITSPLRRYVDLVNERQILHYLEHASPALKHEELAAMLLQFLPNLDMVQQIQRVRPRYWKLLYLYQQTDKAWWPAVVTDENDFQIHVNVPFLQLVLRGKPHLFGDRVHVGQHVEVRIGKVRPLYNEMRLMEVRDMEG